VAFSTEGRVRAGMGVDTGDFSNAGLPGLAITNFDNEMVGLYPNYAAAYAVWKAKAQQSVDNAHMRYFIVHLHRLLDPGQDTKSSR